MVAHFVGRIAQHQHNLLRAFGNAPQADGETVTGQDREDDADGFPAQLRFHIGRDIVNGTVVALGTGNNGFCNGNDIPVTEGKAFAFRSFQYAVGHNVSQVIALTDDRQTDASGYSTY